MPLAFSYIRFSSEKQELGDSLRRQLKLADDYAAQHGLTLDTKSYRDLGISAFKGKNAADGALGLFLKAVDSGLIPRGSYLLLEGLDRLSRAQVDDALTLLLSITNRGITLVTLADGVMYSKESIKANWTQLIIALTISARANEESATKSRRVSAAVQAKINAGIPLGSSMPPWLKLNAEKTGYVQITDKVRVVRKVFAMALAGNGIYLIMKALNAEGVPVLKNATDGWRVSTVSRLVHSESVIGRLVSKHGTFDDHYPAIIDKASFYEVQEAITQRRTNGHGRKGENIANLFSGLCRCAECRSPMRMLRTPTGDGAKVNAYLECIKHFEKRGCEVSKRINYNELERALLNYLLLDRAIKVAPDAPSLTDPSIAIRAEITDKEQQIERLLDAIESTAENRMYQQRIIKRQEELAELRARLKNVVVPRPSADVLAEAHEAFDEHERLKDAPGPELTAARLRLQMVIKQFIEHIDLSPKIVIDKTNKVFGHVQYREAKVLFKGRWDLLLVKRDLEAAKGRELKRLNEDVLKWHEANREPRSVLFRVPKVGGARVKRVPNTPTALPEAPQEA